MDYVVIYEWKCDDCEHEVNTLNHLLDSCPNCGSFDDWWIKNQSRHIVR